MSIPTAEAASQTVMAHHLLDGDGAVLSSHDADRPLYAASTIKLHVVLAALQAAAGGRVGLDAVVPATRSFTGADGVPFTLFGDHLDPTYPADGAPITMRELMVRAIDRSSNEATNHLLELIGLEAVTQTVAALVLHGTRIERKIGDPAALAQGLTNETTAADLASTMLALASPGPAGSSGVSVGHAHRSLVLDALRAQQIPIITSVLASGVDHGSKSGWVPGFRHDVAFMGEEKPWVLAVMTAGMEEEEADQQIRSLARHLLPPQMLATCS